MKLKELQKILDAKPAGDPDDPESGDLEISTCHASDLISDVLAFHGTASLLLTGLTNPQVVRTAEILDFVAICFVRGKKPQGETVKLAREKGIRLLATPLSMYESSGRLYAKGLSTGAGMETTGECRKGK